MNLRKLVDYPNKLGELLLCFLVDLVNKLHAIEGDVDQVTIQQEMLGTFVCEYHEEGFDERFPQDLKDYSLISLVFYIFELSRFPAFIARQGLGSNDQGIELWKTRNGVLPLHSPAVSLLIYLSQFRADQGILQDVYIGISMLDLIHITIRVIYLLQSDTCARIIACVIVNVLDHYDLHDLCLL